MKFFLVILAVLSFGSVTPAFAELGLSAPTAKKPAKKKTSEYRTKEQDEAYNKSIDETDKKYNASTAAVNDPGYENYIGNLDSTLNDMYADIDAGKPVGQRELPKFVPKEVPKDGEGNPITHSEGQSQAADGTAEGATSTEPQVPMTPMQALVNNFCPSMCGQLRNEQEAYQCKTNCAHSAVAPPAAAQQDNSAMLMALLMSSGGDGE